MYRVVWEIDINARTPHGAAEKALATQRNPESTARVFEVTDETGRTIHVDLDEEEKDV